MKNLKFGVQFLLLALFVFTSLGLEAKSPEASIYYDSLDLHIPISQHCLEGEYLRSVDSYKVRCITLTDQEGELEQTCFDSGIDLYLYSPIEILEQIEVDRVPACRNTVTDPASKYFTRGEGSSGGV